MTLISEQEIIKKLNENYYSGKTTAVYLSWILRFFKYHNIKIDQLKLDHIKPYLDHITTDKQLKVTTHNQALNAIVFFYQNILNLEIDKSLISKLRKDHKHSIPNILSREQIESIIFHLKGHYQLLVYLLYGCGLRSSEVLNLKIKDIDFDTNRLTISNPEYLRSLAMPTKITNDLKNQIDFITSTYTKDIKSKFFNNTGKGNCYLFPMKQLSNDINGKLIRSPIISNTLNYNITTASKKAGINFKVTAQTFRHSYAVHLLQNQIDIKTVQKLLGHKHASSTLIYSYATQKISKDKALSPLDLE